MIAPALAARVEAALGERITAARPTSGGSIADAYLVELSTRGPAFLKTHASMPGLAMKREAEGLAWLAESGAVKVPRVLASSEEGDAFAFLVLEQIDTGGRGRADEERFGRELAALHAFGASGFGLDASNFLATLPQDNAPSASWATFYRESRLEPLVARARSRGLVDGRLARKLDALYARLEDLVGPTEPPARLHGDLWGGNRVVDRVGASWLIDPAVYGGHREMDLAMMRLFGGFGARAFEAYQEATPLAAGAEARVALYQLYPLLAHVVMFGGGYVGQVEAALDAYV